MNTLQQPFRRQFAQVAADRILRKIELGADILGDDPSVAAQAFEEELFSMSSKHCTKLHDLARNVTPWHW